MCFAVSFEGKAIKAVKKHDSIDVSEWGLAYNKSH